MHNLILKTLGAFLFAAALVPGAARAEIAVIPYRVENPSDTFRPDNGLEYAKLIAVVLAVSKGVTAYSFRDLAVDMKGFGIQPQGTVTAEQLVAFGKGRYIDLIVLGSLSRAGGTYAAESAVFSVADGKVISRSTVKGENLFQCAQKEVSENFIAYSDRRDTRVEEKPADIALVFDLSYNVAREWPDMRRGFLSLCAGMTDEWSREARVYLAPFSSVTGPPVEVKAVVSPASLRNEMEKLKPKGGNSATSLERALKHAAAAVPWRKGSVRLLVVVSNSPVEKSPVSERHVLGASKKGVSVSVIALGKLRPGENDFLRRLAAIGKGSFRQAAYRQRVYDMTGEATDIYMEAGRLFRSRGGAGDWRDGLYKKGGDPNSRYAEPRAFLSEVMFDERKLPITPYTMGEKYADAANVRVLRADVLANNTEALLGALGDEAAAGMGRAQAARVLGRALLSDGKLSLWVNITNAADLAFFEKTASSGYYFPLGVTVQRKGDEPYGMTFSPRRFVTGLNDEMLPALAVANLGSIIDKPDYYTDNGLFSPPVWFVKVKVEQVKRTHALPDVRQRNN